MASNPVFPLYYNDIDRSTRDWTDEEFGCYMRLLMHQWDKGEIPKDPQRLSRIVTSLGSSWVTVGLKFTEKNTGLVNERLEEIRAERLAFSKKQSQNGKNGGRPPVGSSKEKAIKQEVSDWNEMLNFFNNSCIDCGYIFPDGDRPTKDHIVPQKNGGTNHITNYQPLCRSCNSSKSANHSTDFRLKFIDTIPEKLKEKWFKKPKNNPNESLHYEEEIEIEEEIKEFGKSENLFENQQIVPTICRNWYSSFPTYTKDQSEDFKAVLKIVSFLQKQNDIIDINSPPSRELIITTVDQVIQCVMQEQFWVNKPLKSIANNIQEFLNKIKNPLANGHKSNNQNGNGKPSSSEARIKAVSNF